MGLDEKGRSEKIIVHDRQGMIGALGECVMIPCVDRHSFTILIKLSKLYIIEYNKIK